MTEWPNTYPPPTASQRRRRALIWIGVVASAVVGVVAGLVARWMW